MFILYWCFKIISELKTLCRFQLKHVRLSYNLLIRKEKEITKLVNTFRARCCLCSSLAPLCTLYLFMALVFVCNVRLRGGSVFPLGQELLLPVTVASSLWPEIVYFYDVSCSLCHPVNGNRLSWPWIFPWTACIYLDWQFTGMCSFGINANIILASVEGKKEWAREHRHTK